MDHGAEPGLMTWTAPECPLRIEYSARVLDEIRLAVVDAFFSLPRGGAEIGGILLGEYQDKHIAINGYEALDCEHAMGPSFNLSPRDQQNLAEMTARAKRNAASLQPVGWYHSHTRSEIFLSDADQDLHNRYFPEPWQIALVLKPHTFEPTRGGFFFREADGSVHADGSYREFHLDPLPLKPASGSNGTPVKSRREFREEQQSPVAPAAAPTQPAEDSAPSAPEAGKRRVPITREIVVDPTVTAPAASSNLDLPVPGWDAASKERPWRAMKAAAILALGLAIGGAGYQTRDYWLPKVLTKARAVLPKAPDSYLALTLSDDNGQMKIAWDRYSPAVREALEATLEISDGNTTPQSVRLDGAHLGIGAFTYVREHERVDVTLIVSEQGGKIVKDQSSFLGKLPAQRVGEQVAAPSAGAEKERVDKLQQDANFQASKIRKLEKDLKAAQDQLQNQQKDKQDSPAPDPTKKN